MNAKVIAASAAIALVGGLVGGNLSQNSYDVGYCVQSQLQPVLFLQDGAGFNEAALLTAPINVGGAAACLINADANRNGFMDLPAAIVLSTTTDTSVF